MSRNPNQTLIKRPMLLVSILVCIGSIGCQSRPAWGPPGTIGMQRTRAVLHDPYPSNELGPSIIGVRPRGYDQPRSETTSLQTSPFARRSMQGGQFTPTYGF